MDASDAPLGIRGLGTDLVEIERFRLALQRRASLPDGSSPTASSAYAYEHHDPVHAWRPASAPRKR